MVAAGPVVSAAQRQGRRTPATAALAWHLPLPEQAFRVAVVAVVAQKGRAVRLQAVRLLPEVVRVAVAPAGNLRRLAQPIPAAVAAVAAAQLTLQAKPAAAAL